MAIKVNIGVSKKVGLPDYGSAGASCNLELEVDSHLLESDLAGFRDRVRAAYGAAHQAVLDQIQRLQGVPEFSGSHDASDDGANGHRAASGNGNGRAHAARGGTRSWGGTDRFHAPSVWPNKPATAGQVKAIYSIARQVGANLGELLSEHGVANPEDLSIKLASALIDRLKAQEGG